MLACQQSVSTEPRPSPGAPAVQVALPICEELQSIRCEPILIHQHMVVTGLVMSFQASMAIQEEVKLGGVADVPINHSTRQAVPGLVSVAVVPRGGEEAGVVPLLHHHKSDGRAVAPASLHGKAGLWETELAR